MENWKKYLIFFMAILLIFVYFLYSPKYISGKVFDLNSKTPLADVLIVASEKSPDWVCSTDSNGSYFCHIPSKDLNKFSFLKEGYLEENYSLTKFKFNRNVYLRPNNVHITGKLVQFNFSIVNGKGEYYLSNGDFFSFTYDFFEGKYSNFKINFPKGGVLYLGESKDFSGYVPLKNYESSQDLNSGIYGFINSEGHYGFLNLDLKNNYVGEEFVFIQGNYTVKKSYL